MEAGPDIEPPKQMPERELGLAGRSDANWRKMQLFVGRLLDDSASTGHRSRFLSGSG